MIYANKSLIKYTFYSFFLLLELQPLAIAKFLVARDNDTVAWVEAFDDFVVLRILATEANISAGSPFTIRIHHIDPSWRVLPDHRRTMDLCDGCGWQGCYSPRYSPQSPKSAVLRSHRRPPPRRPCHYLRLREIWQ